MDVVLELKAQYAGYTTGDLYVTFERMRRNGGSRPVFEHLAHDFSVGLESVNTYWDGQARMWREWKTPTDECVNCVSGSTFLAGFTRGPDPARWC